MQCYTSVHLSLSAVKKMIEYIWIVVNPFVAFILHSNKFRAGIGINWSFCLFSFEYCFFLNIKRSIYATYYHDLWLFYLQAFPFPKYQGIFQNHTNFSSSTIIIPILPFQFKIDGKIALWENDPKIAFLTTDLKSSNLQINWIYFYILAFRNITESCGSFLIKNLLD